MPTLKKKIAAFLLAILVGFINAPFASAAGDFHWEFAGWYGGGCFPNVEFDPHVKDQVYLVSDVSGIWKSSNGGEQWIFKTAGLGNLSVAQLAVSPQDPNVLYVATEGGIFYSQNGGDLWSKTDNLKGAITFKRPHSYKAIAVSAFNPQKLCVGTVQGKLFCSRDAGETWSPIRAYFKRRTPITSLSFTPDESELIVGNGSGLYRYNFQRRAWYAFFRDPYPVTDFVVSKKAGWIAAAGEKYLAISTDGGRSWRRSTDVPTGKTYRLALKESHDRQTILVAWTEGWSGGIISSIDGGLSWQVTENKFKPDIENNPARNLLPRRNPTALKLDPFNSERIFLTDWWGVWRSDNGGIVWSEKVKGAPNAIGSDIFISSQGEIFAGTMDNGLLKSSDQGKTYQTLFPLSGYSQDINGHVWRVVITGSNRIVATTSPWDQKVNQVILSDNGGESFEIVRAGLPAQRPRANALWGESFPRALAVDPRDPNIIFLGMDGDDSGGLFISVDGGHTWERSSGQPGSLRVYNGLAVDHEAAGTLYWGTCGEGGGVYKSADRGKTWEKVFSQKCVLDLHMSASGVLYAAGAGTSPAVYASYDKGVNWEELYQFHNEGSSAADAIMTSRSRPDIVVVSTLSWEGRAPQKIYLSSDGGKNWKDITGDLPPGSGAAAMAFDPQGGSLYIARYAGSVYKMVL